MRALIRWTKRVASRSVGTLTRHLPSGNLVGTIYRTPNGIFSISAADIYIANVLRRNHAWAAEEVFSISAATEAGSRVLFVGAHIGTLVIPVSRQAGEVVAIEANPDTYRFLMTNLMFNDVTNVTVHQVAAGEADGEIEFLLSRENSGGAKRRPVKSDPRYVYDHPSVVRVPMKRLDDLVEGSFSTIVMDIEGSEYFALKGMPRLLAGAERLFIEFLPHHIRNVAGVTSDEFCDLILPHLPSVTIGGRRFDGEAARLELRRMFEAEKDEDLICFSRVA